MAKQGIDIGLMYGRAKYRNFSMSAADDNITALRATLGKKTYGISYPDTLTMSADISPGAKCTVEADVKGVEVDASNRLYHDGSTPKQGNYYYNKQSTYVFERWEDDLTGLTVMTSRMGESTYTFTMPMIDVALAAHSQFTDAEVSKVYAREIKIVNASAGLTSGAWPISSVAIKEGSEVKATGNTEAARYFWENPIDVIKLVANLTPRNDNTDGQWHYLTGSSNPSNGNIKWYIRTDYYVTRLLGTDGTDEYTSNTVKNIHVTRDVTYSYSGEFSITRTNTVGCESALVTSSNYTEYKAASSTVSATTSYSRWYWKDDPNQPGNLNITRTDDISFSESYKAQNEGEGYVKTIIENNRQLLLEYGIKQKDIYGNVTGSYSTTYRGTFTTIDDSEVNIPTRYFQSEDRGWVSSIHTIKRTSHYTWEGKYYQNRFGVLGNGEVITYSTGYYTRINMFSGDITYRGHHFEWWITKDCSITFNAYNNQTYVNKFINLLAKQKKLKTSCQYYGSSIIPDTNVTTWVKSNPNAEVPWRQYIITRIDRHWGVRDNRPGYENYSTTFSLASKSAKTKTKTVYGDNKIKRTVTITSYTHWRQLINENGENPSQTLMREASEPFHFSFYTYKMATLWDYPSANTANAEKTKYRENSSYGRYWLAYNFDRMSMTWADPLKNDAYPNGIFETFAAKSSKTQSIHTVAHLTMPYLGHMDEYVPVQKGTFCEFMTHPGAINTGTKSTGEYYESPYPCNYEMIWPSNVAKTAVKSVPMNSTYYNNLYYKAANSGSAQNPNIVVSNSTFGVHNYKLFSPEAKRLTELQKTYPSFNGAGSVWYTFSTASSNMNRIHYSLYTKNNVAGTGKSGDPSKIISHYRVPELYTTSLPLAFGDANKSMFYHKELGSTFPNNYATSFRNPENFTFGKVYFSSSNVVYSLKARSNTATAYELYVRPDMFTPDGYLISNKHHALQKVKFGNVYNLRHDIAEAMRGELHDIEFTKTIEGHHYTNTYYYESGVFDGNSEVPKAVTNYLTQAIQVDKEVVPVTIIVEKPNVYSPDDDDGENEYDDRDNEDFVIGETDTNILDEEDP